MRVAFIHTGAVVIAPVVAEASAALGDVEIVNYLDDRIVGDLAADQAGSVPGRVADLARAARSAGADVVMLTCSSISALAAPTAAAVGIPVLRIDEAMADDAVAAGERIAVLATLPTTLAPTVALIQERAAAVGRAPRVAAEVIDGAFAAVSGGDRAGHDRMVREAIARVGQDADVIVLAQASMASAAEGAATATPVLSSIRPGIARLAAHLARGSEETA